MHRKLYKELWRLRFEKMLSLERKSITDYQSLLLECQPHPKGAAIRPHLEQLIQDEKKHVALCEELLKILARQPDKLSK